ncbi:MAG: DUF2029 domain-containing protein [Proteobacteria bacterium]|nr:DUF2029 domain-containing protein [Pseudomonadota bacterium]
MDSIESAQQLTVLWPFGTRDFVQYWSAFQLLLGGHNPYDALQMFRVQQSIGFPGELPVLMWNPPWLLLLLAPILILDFQAATAAWCVLNIIMLCAIPFLVGNTSMRQLPRSRFAFFATLVLLFIPALDSIRSGQLGVGLAFGAALFIRGLKNKSMGVAAVGLLVLSVKPHFAAMLGLAALMPADLGRERLRLCLVTAGISAVVASMVSLYRPAILWEWIEALRKRPEVGVSLMEWRTDTLTGFLRAQAQIYMNSSAEMLLYLVPLALILGMVMVVATVPKVSAVMVVQIMAVLAPSFAPYGWVSDYTLALPALVALFCAAPPKPFVTGAIWYLIAMAASAPFFFSTGPIRLYVFLFPVALLPAVISVCRAQLTVAVRSDLEKTPKGR